MTRQLVPVLCSLFALACSSKDEPTQPEDSGAPSAGEGEAENSVPEGALARITFHYQQHASASSDACEMAYTGFATESVDCPDCAWAFTFQMDADTLACPDMWVPEGSVDIGMNEQGPYGPELVYVYGDGSSYWYDDLETWDGTYFRGLTWSGSDGTFNFTHWTTGELLE